MRKNLPLIFMFLSMTGCSSMSSGWSAYQSGDYDKAGLMAASSIMEDPGNEEAYRLAAFAHIAKQNPAAAVSAAERSVELSSRRRESLEALLMSLESAKMYGAYCEIANELSGRAQLSERGVSTQQIRDALAEASESEPSSAFDCLEVLRRRKIGVDFEREENARLLREKVHVLIRRGDLNEARRVLSEVPSPIFDLQRARVAYLSQDTAKEKVYLSSYEQSNLNRDEKNRALAEYCEQSKDYAAAGKYWAEVSGIEARFRGALAYFRAGLFEQGGEALARYAKVTDSRQCESSVKMLRSAGFALQAANLGENCPETSPELQWQIAEIYDDSDKSFDRDRVIDAIAQKSGDDRQSLLRIFRFYAKRGISDKAELYGTRLVKAGEISEELLFEISEVYAKNLRFSEMNALLEKAIAKNNSPELRLRVASLNEKYYLWPQVIRHAKSVFDNDKRNEHALSLLLRAYKAQGNEKESNASLDKWATVVGYEADQAICEEKIGFDPRVACLKALARMQSRRDEAADYYAALIAVRDENYVEAEKFLSRMLENPKLNEATAESMIALYHSSVKDPSILYERIRLLHRKFPDNHNITLAWLRSAAQSERIDDVKTAFYGSLSQSEIYLETFRESYARHHGKEKAFAFLKMLQDNASHNNMFLLSYIKVALRLSRESKEVAVKSRYDEIIASSAEKYIERESENLESFALLMHSEGMEEAALSALNKIGQKSFAAAKLEIIVLLNLNKEEKAEKAIEAIAKRSDATNENLVIFASEVVAKGGGKAVLPILKKIFESDRGSAQINAANEWAFIEMTLGHKDTVIDISERLLKSNDDPYAAARQCHRNALRIENIEKAKEYALFMLGKRKAASEPILYLSRLQLIAPDNKGIEKALYNALRNAPASVRLMSIQSQKDAGRYAAALKNAEDYLRTATAPSSDILKLYLPLTIENRRFENAEKELKTLASDVFLESSYIVSILRLFSDYGQNDILRRLLIHFLSLRPSDTELHRFKVEDAYRNGKSDVARQSIDDAVESGVSAQRLIDVAISHEDKAYAIRMVQKIAESHDYAAAAYYWRLLKDSVVDKQGYQNYFATLSFYLRQNVEEDSGEISLSCIDKDPELCAAESTLMAGDTFEAQKILKEKETEDFYEVALLRQRLLPLTVSMPFPEASESGVMTIFEIFARGDEREAMKTFLKLKSDPCTDSSCQVNDAYLLKILGAFGLSGEASEVLKNRTQSFDNALSGFLFDSAAATFDTKTLTPKEKLLFSLLTDKVDRDDVEKFLKRTPVSSKDEALSLVALYALRSKSAKKQAEEIFDAHIRRSFAPLQAVLQVADVCDRFVLRDFSVQYYRQALKLSPSQASIRVAYARSLARLGKFDEAVEQTLKATERSSGTDYADELLKEDLPAAFKIAVVKRQIKERGETPALLRALLTYASEIGDEETVNQVSVRLMALFPNRIHASTILRLNVEKNRHASDASEKALAFIVQNANESEDLILASEAFAQKKDFKNAYACAVKSLELSADYTVASLKLAEIFRQYDNLSLVEQFILKARAFSPQSPAPLFYLALLQNDRGKDGLQDYHKAVRDGFDEDKAVRLFSRKGPRKDLLASYIRKNAKDPLRVVRSVAEIYRDNPDEGLTILLSHMPNLRIFAMLSFEIAESLLPLARNNSKFMQEIAQSSVILRPTNADAWSLLSKVSGKDFDAGVAEYFK